MNKIWVREPISKRQMILFSALGIMLTLIVWMVLTTADKPEKRLISRNVLPNPIDVITSFPSLISGNANWMLILPPPPGSSASKDVPLINSPALSRLVPMTKIEPGTWEAILTFSGKSETSFTIRSQDGSESYPKQGYPVKNNRPYKIRFSEEKKSVTAVDVGFMWQKSLLFAIWISLRRELISFIFVILIGVPLGILMSVNNNFRSFFYPLLIVGSFIPIAALIPLTQAFFGIEEEQKIIFLALGMFFVLLGLVIKEMDEVDTIYLETAYTLGFNQLQTVFLVNFPAALPRIWKHFAAIFGIGWGYIIFAEMVNSGGGSDELNGIGWLFIAKQRRMKVTDMYAIFFVIIFFAFLFSWLFKAAGKFIFKHERNA